LKGSIVTAPWVIHRQIHPHVAVQFTGPLSRPLLEDDEGESLPGWFEVSPRQAVRAASLAGPRVARWARALRRAAVVGVYHAVNHDCEIRWSIDRGARHCRLRVVLSPEVDPYKYMGRYFGYPECCTDDLTPGFTLPGYSQSPLCGTGFVPCPHCYTHATAADLVTQIQARRCSPLPFPDDHPVLDDFWMAQAVIEGRLAVPLIRP
jgi:hypothetical protein